jgi:hypothetical protein
VTRFFASQKFAGKTASWHENFSLPGGGKRVQKAKFHPGILAGSDFPEARLAFGLPAHYFRA